MTPDDPSARPADAPAPAAPAAPPVTMPTMPITMAVAPEESAANAADLPRKHFPGELDGDYEEIRRRVELMPAPGSRLRRLMRAIAQSLPFARWRRRVPDSDDRHVAYDGFTDPRYEDKLERDRRYGTVYRVTEARNAYLVRLEIPRRVPSSAIKHAWKLPDEMPAYDYTISLGDNFLAIRAGLRGEAMRRAAYVSASFPSQFLTRIEFAQPVAA